MKKRGFSMLDVILTTVLIAVALIALYATFGSGYRHSVMTRNQIAANFLVSSFFEEVQAHDYGNPAPPSWPVAGFGTAAVADPPAGWQGAGFPSTQSLPVYVEGRVQASNFHRQLTLANGSLVGKTPANWDEVTLTVTWEELASKDNTKGLKRLTARRLVWRENGVQ